MQHTPPAPHPLRQTLENIIAFPSVVLNDAAQKKQTHKKQILSQMELQEKEESLSRLQSALHARSAEIRKKEQVLSERWDAGRIYSLPIAAISANPCQPRREFEELSLFSLANSIREHGILQPLTVRRVKSDGDTDQAETLICAETPVLSDAQYQLICGERRLRAASSIGMKTVPCIILDADNRRAAELALIENLQRENLNLFEQAGAIAALMDMHAMTQEEIARALSVSQSCIANKLRVLRLTTDEREIILSAHMTERHARAFLRIKDLELRRKTVRAAARASLNVAQTEQYVESILSEVPQRTPLRAVPDHPAAAPSQPSTDTAAPPVKKCILRDLRLFFNTIERAVSAVREAGYTVYSEKSETDGTVTLTVSIAAPGGACDR